MNDEKRLKTKHFEKENHVILEQTKFTSLATTITISISLFISKEQQNLNPINRKKKSHPKQPCKQSLSSLYHNFN
jgi:hypothetical protein